MKCHYRTPGLLMAKLSGFYSTTQLILAFRVIKLSYGEYSTEGRRHDMGRTREDIAAS